MFFQPVLFLLGQRLAESRGLPRAEAARVGIVSSFVRPPLGIVAAVAMTRGKNPAPPANPAVPVLAPANVPVPDVRTSTTGTGFYEAITALWGQALAVQVIGDPAGGASDVVYQDPAPNTMVPIGSPVTIVVQPSVA